MWNKELYVREQQDAYEFFTSLIDQMDEYLKVKTSGIFFSLYTWNFLIPFLCSSLFFLGKEGRETLELFYNLSNVQEFKIHFVYLVFHSASIYN